MSQKKNTSPFYSHAKLILADWKVPSQLILDIIQPTREKIHGHAPTHRIETLDDTDIQRALNSPLGTYLEYVMSAYAILSEAKALLTQGGYDYCQETMVELKKKSILNENVYTQSSTVDISALGKELNKLIESQRPEWHNFVEHWNTTLLHTFADNNHELSSHDTTDFTVEEPFYELENRFTELNIPRPETHYAEQGFTVYYQLKCYLQIYNMLAKLQQANDASEVLASMKKFQPVFKAVQAQQQELEQSQGQAIKKLISDLI